MLKNEFAKGLLLQSPKSLAFQLAMWDNLTLWGSTWKRVLGILKKTDFLNSAIESESVRYKLQMNVQQLQLETLYRLCGNLNVEMPERLTAGDLDDLCEKLSNLAVSILRRTDKRFTGNNVTDMVAHVVRIVFNDLSDKFEKEDESTQESILQAIMDDIQKMPKEQRERLKKELKIKEFTNASIRKTLLNGSLGAAFVTIIQIAGFSAYVAATKILAATAALVGITLPFTAYTFLTSAIAFVVNPLVVIPLALGLGCWLTKRTNKKIRDSLTPAFITQAILSSSSEDLNKDSRQALETFLAEYNSRQSAVSIEPLQL